MTRFASALLAAVALSLAMPVAAQQRPLVQAGAGGRYETKLDPKRAVPGFAPARVAAFRGSMERLIAQFAGMPQVTAPPEPVCHRLESWVEINPPHGVLSGVVEVMQPITFERGRCHNMTRTGVHVRFNSLSELLDPQQAHVRSDSRNSHFWVLPVEVAGRRVIDLGDRVAFTHGRAPLLLPVSAERYLREQIRRLPEGPKGGAAGELARWLNGGKAKMLAENATQLREMSAYLKPADLTRIAEGQRVVVDSTEKELRRAAAQRPEPTPREHAEADLAALSPAQRGAPACIAHDTGMFDATPGCPRGETLVELNPAYFDRSRPGAVQLVVAQTPDGRTHGESEAEFAARRAIWSALDRAALAALVE